MYDNNAASGSVLWNGIGPTLTIPPIIKSTSGFLFITYKSDVSDPVKYFGFLGEYYINYVGSAGSGIDFYIIVVIVYFILII